MTTKPTEIKPVMEYLRDCPRVNVTAREFCFSAVRNGVTLDDLRMLGACESIGLEPLIHGRFLSVSGKGE